MSLRANFSRIGIQFTRLFNTRVEPAFLLHKLELVKGAISLEAMQMYAALFTATLEDWIHRFPNPDDRVLNERLVNYFYKGIEPETLSR